MDLLERSSALGELGGLLAATATGGRVVLVAGEAGIGKSSLVRQFAERHSAHAWFLLGACDPLLTPRALGPLHDIARQTGGRLAGRHAWTGGNPLLVTEVLAAGDAGVPMTVRDLVLARLGGLPADAQEVVRLVAVVPTQAELWLLERALGPPPAAVEAGVTAGLLVAGPEAVGFRHELLRRAVEGSLSALARRALNRRVLEALAGAPDRPVDLARL